MLNRPWTGSTCGSWKLNSVAYIVKLRGSLHGFVAKLNIIVIQNGPTQERIIGAEKFMVTTNPGIL